MPVLSGEVERKRLNYTILLAGGSGSRFGAKKQYLNLGGVPVWERALGRVREGGAQRVVIVVPAGDEQAVADALRRSRAQSCVEAVVAGGTSRSASVQQGLLVLSKLNIQSNDLVAIHDAARPFAHPDDIRAVFAQAIKCGGAILGRPCLDTVKRVQGSRVLETVARDALVLASTPQVFQWSWLRQVYLHADDMVLASATDDASLMEAAGFTVAVVLGRHPNPKITQPEDWEYAKWLIEQGGDQ